MSPGSGTNYTMPFAASAPDAGTGREFVIVSERFLTSPTLQAASTNASVNCEFLGEVTAVGYDTIGLDTLSFYDL